jgi:hypothetical protein
VTWLTRPAPSLPKSIWIRVPLPPLLRRRRRLPCPSVLAFVKVHGQVGAQILRVRLMLLSIHGRISFLRCTSGLCQHGDLLPTFSMRAPQTRPDAQQHFLRFRLTSLSGLSSSPGALVRRDPCPPTALLMSVSNGASLSPILPLLETALVLTTHARPRPHDPCSPPSSRPMPTPRDQ